MVNSKLANTHNFHTLLKIMSAVSSANKIYAKVHAHSSMDGLFKLFAFLPSKHFDYSIHSTQNGQGKCVGKQEKAA